MCVVTNSFDPFDVSQMKDLWNLTRELRESDPVARLESGVVYVSRYRDARHVFRNPQVFSSRHGFKAESVEVPLGDATLGELDEPEHEPARRLAMAAAGPSRVEGERGYAYEVATGCVADLGGDGTQRAEAVADLALPLSSQVTAHMLGMPPADAEMLVGWAEDIMHSEFPTRLRTERGAGYHGAFPEFAGYIDSLIDERMEHPDRYDDAVAAVVRGVLADAELSESQAARPMTFMILSTLILGGITTTRDFIGFVVYELLNGPDIHETLWREPPLVKKAVDETLRLYPPILYEMRRCTQDTALGGVAINRGDRVLVGIASANRDEEVFPDPDSFRLDRPGAQHLSFGHGIHMCVGNGLARMEGQEALRALLERFAPGDLRLAPDFQLELMPQPFMYGPKTVEIRVERSKSEGKASWTA